MKTSFIGISLWVCSVGVCFAQLNWNVNLVGSNSAPSYASDVAVKGNYVYVADKNYGMRVIDITNPAAPVAVGFYDTPGEAFGVAVTGNYAYLADKYYGLRVINISNPATPIEAGFCDTPGWASEVAVAAAGNYACIADDYNGLRVINVMNPASPWETGFYDTPGKASGVAMAGIYAYVAHFSGNSLRVINISNPAAPTEAGYYTLPDVGYSVAVAGNYAYVAGTVLRIINVSNPVAPSQSGFYDTPGLGYGVTVAGNYAYVADFGSGLRVIDITNPAAPVEAGYYNTPGNAEGVAVVGNYAYVADGSNGLGIYDCSAATGGDGTPSPFVIDANEFHPPHGPQWYSDLRWCVELRTDQDFTIEIKPLDLYEDPIMQVLPGCNYGQDGCNVECDPAVFIYDQNAWIYDPADSSWSNTIIVLESGCACLSLEGIWPVELLSFEAIPGDRQISLHWTTASETDNDHFDIERDGSVMGRVEATNSATGSTYNWSEVNLINGREYVYSLISVNISDEREVIGTASATPTMNAAAITEYVLHQNYPNPFNPETNITFDIVEAGEVMLTVYNSTGQTVATLVNGAMPSGRHSVTFDASTLPSGLYFYRLNAADFTAVKKMVLMK